MKTALFIILVVISGSLAGAVHGFANLLLVEPYLDKAIMIENRNLFASGEADDTPKFWAEYESYRLWQKEGQVLAGIILGTSFGALFGIVFAYSRKILPGINNVKKALALAGIMWFTIYFIPFLKYPANPPTVGDAETVVLRGILYLSFIAISGFGAVGCYQLYKRLRKERKIIAFGIYAALITSIFVLMPPNPDDVTAPNTLVNSFRIMSVIGVSIYWISLGIILGIFWQRFHPDKPLHQEIQ